MQFPMLNDVTLPKHHNFHNRGQTLYWAGSDSLERFQTHCKSSIRKTLLASLGFSDTGITYTYNSYGFRDEEFDNRPCGLAFGCSHTEGTGLPNGDAWPRVLSNLTGNWVWNFGVGGSSLDTVFRLLDFWLPYFDPKFVIVCIPESSRVEVFDQKWPASLSSHYPETTILGNYYKVWASSQYNIDITQRKNLLAIEKLCNDRNIRLITTDWTEIEGDALARDLMHTGAIGHRKFAEKIKEKL